MARARVFAVVLSLLATACPTKETPTPGDDNDETLPSPNASILPAPLTSAAERAAKDAGRGGLLADPDGKLLQPEAGPVTPTAFPRGTALPRDTLSYRDGVGVTLEARFRWQDVPPPAKTPESAAEAIKKAREAIEPTLTVDLAPAGRMRWLLTSPVFPLPQNAELRATTEHFGHLLVWPDGNAYRVLLPGTLRALLSERRADVLPLTAGTSKPAGQGGLLGLDTQKTEIKSEAGRIVIEQANVVGVGRSGALLCRALLELVAVDPSNPTCDDLVPLRAEFAWTGGGRLSFDVTAIVRKPELPIGTLVVPPAGAQIKPGELPPQASGVLVDRATLAGLRTKAATSGEPPGPEAPGEGLVAVNRTTSLRYLLVDSVPVAWVKPSSEQYLIGLRPGRYAIGWRDFLGTAVRPAESVDVPARVIVGEQPAETAAKPQSK